MDFALCFISCFDGLFVSLPLLGSSLEECSKNVKKRMETMTFKKGGEEAFVRLVIYRLPHIKTFFLPSQTCQYMATAQHMMTSSWWCAATVGRW